MKVFVYATLKEAGIQKEALGHTLKGDLAYVFGYRERFLAYDGTSWPTLTPDRDSVVQGETFDVSAQELKRLDAWEDAYRRIKVDIRPSGEVAWAFTLDPTKLARNE